MAAPSYIRLKDIAAAIPSSIDANAQLLMVAGSGSQSSVGVLGSVNDVKSFMLQEVNTQITQLFARPGNGSFVNPITLALTGQATGSVSFDGTKNVSMGVTIPDGALATTAVSGLATTLASVSTSIAALQSNKLESSAAAVAAVKLQTARNVSLTGVVTSPAVLFDGTTDLTLATSIANGSLSIANTNGLQSALDGKLASTATAASAVKLQTARNIGGVPFDGTGDINLPGVNVPGGQNSSGNAYGVTFIDTRGTASLPSAVRGQSLSAEFKSVSDVGNPPVAQLYNMASILNLWNWGSSDGGLPTQFSIGDGLAIRRATDINTWGPWRTVWHDGNLNPASFLGVNAKAASAVVADSAGRWSNARTLTLSGPVTGAVAIDGTGNPTLTTSIANNALAVSTVNGLQSALDGKQYALGYTPVQQGTGIGQLSNTVKIGWSGSTLKATVDSTDLGALALQSSLDASNTNTTSQLATKRNIIPVVLGIVDLNTIVTTGDYTQQGNSNAASGANYPAPLAGALEVVSNGSGTFVWQRYTTYYNAAGGNVSYTRNLYSGTWSPWQQTLRMGDWNPQGRSGGWSTPRSIALIGAVSGTLTLDGTSNVSMNTTLGASIPGMDVTFGGSSACSDFNVTPATNVFDWSPSVANLPSGMGQYGMGFTVANIGGHPQPNAASISLNQLCFDTGGNLFWRYNVNAGGWSTVKLWHSGNFNPNNYVTNGSSPTFGGILIGGGNAPYIYGDSGTYNPLNIRVSSAAGPSYFAFRTDGSFAALNGGITANGSVSGAYASLSPSSQFRGITMGGLIPTLTSSTTANPGYFGSGNGDGAASTMNNVMIGSWQGIGFGPTIPGMIVPIGSYSHWFNARTGDMGMVGNLTTGGSVSAIGLSSNANITAGKNSEGQVWLGNNDYYYFGNANYGGFYSTSAGYAYRWDFSSRTFTVFGVFDIQSDARVKKDFKTMEPRPLWRKLDMLSWKWKANNETGYGPKAQDVEKVAPEYVREDKDTPICTSKGASKRKIANAKKRIAEGKERGMLSVDKIDLTLEMAMAAGHYVDALEERVAKLESLLSKALEAVKPRRKARG